MLRRLEVPFFRCARGAREFHFSAARGALEPVAPHTVGNCREARRRSVTSIAAFGMFAITGTKYHHDVLPLVPAATTLAGVLCQQAYERTRLLVPSVRSRPS